MLAEYFFDLTIRCRNDGLVGFDTREGEHGLANDADAHAFQAARRATAEIGCVGLVGKVTATHGGKYIARIVVTIGWALQCIEHLGSIGHGATLNASAVIVHVIANGTTEVGD